VSHEMNHEVNKVNTVMDRDCGYMDGMTKEQIQGAIGDALASFDEKVNTVVSGLARLPEAERDLLAGEVLADMEGRLQWARETIGYRG